MMQQPGPPANNKKLDKLKPTTTLENWAMGLIELGAQSRETKEVRPKTILELYQKSSSKPQHRDPNITQCHLLKETEVSPQDPDPEKYREGSCPEKQLQNSSRSSSHGSWPNTQPSMGKVKFLKARKKKQEGNYKRNNSQQSHEVWEPSSSGQPG